MNEASQSGPARSGRIRGWLRLWGMGMSLVFLLALPGLRMLTRDVNRLQYHTDALFLFSLVALAGILGGAFAVGWRLAARIPGKFAQRLMLAAAVGFAGQGFVQLLLNTLDLHALQSAVKLRYGLILWVLLAAPVALWRAGEARTRAWARALLLVLMPLGPVLLISIAWTGLVPAVRQPQPARLSHQQPGSPFYLLVFDALDRKRTLDRGDASTRFPALARLRQCAHEFPNARTPARGTTNVIPMLLFQKRGEVVQGPDGLVAIDGQPTQQMDSILEMASGPHTVRVVGGFHLNYSRLFRPADGWLREHSLYNGTQYDAVTAGRGAAWFLVDHEFLPRDPVTLFLRRAIGTGQLATDIPVHIESELRSQLLACAGAPNADLAAFFHLSVPHTPFIWTRDGLRDGDDPTLADPEQGYLSNAEYADFLLGKVMDAMAASGQWERATFVVTGDHGMNYEDNPPLLVKLPGQTHAVRQGQTLYTSDLWQWLKQQPEMASRR